MKILRPFFRYCIDRAVDRERPLQGLTAWFVARDPLLSRYETQIRSVDDRLHRDLAAHLERPCAEQIDVEQVASNRPLATPIRADEDSLQTTSTVSAKTRFPFVTIVAAVMILLVFSAFWVLNLENSEKGRLTGQIPGQMGEDVPVQKSNPIPAEMVATIPKDGDFPKHIGINGDTATPFPALAELQDFLNREDRDSLGEILTLLGRIPRPNEAFPLPSREAVYDSLAASNPVCSYLIECYVRPAFEDDARHLHNSDENSGKL